MNLGALVRVARGWFVDATTWHSWFPERKHLAAVVAAHRTAAHPPLFSHFSAAVLLGLPLWNFRGGRVHTAQPTSNPSSATVMRHRLDIPDSHTGTVAGYRCTSPARTLADLAKLASTETLLGCADVVLARAAKHGRNIDDGAWQQWAEEMRALAAALPPKSRGRAHFRRVVELADPRADSVLESVSRLQLLRLGYDLNLQVPVPGPTGNSYFIDFELLGCQVFGECDGEVKYTDTSMLAGRTPTEAVLAEKRRDNWTAGTTGHRLVHWGARDVITAEHLGRLLMSFHVPLPRMR